MDGQRAKHLMRGVAALALTMSLAVAARVGPVRQKRRLLQ
jgi:hypothetical protein